MSVPFLIIPSAPTITDKVVVLRATFSQFLFSGVCIYLYSMTYKIIIITIFSMVDLYSSERYELP